MAIRDRAPAERLSVINNPCGRCGGTGEVPFWNEATKEADKTYCGICGGTGASTMRFDTIGAQAVSFGSKHYADGVSAIRSAGAARGRGRKG